MEQWLIQLSVHPAFWIYLLIIVLACAEGPILSIGFGLLIKLGYFNFWPIYVALMLGDLVGDTAWYWIGRRYGKKFVARFGKYFSINLESISKVEKLFHRYDTRILIISKLTMGFGFAVVTLFTAGMSKVHFKKYLALNLSGQFIWTGLLMAVGYFFGHLYQTFEGIFARISITALVLLTCAALFGYGKYIQKHFTKISTNAK